jgi:hypothetical protein
MNPLPGLKPRVSGLYHVCHDLRTCRKRPPLRSERMPFIPRLESLGFSGIAYKSMVMSTNHERQARSARTSFVPLNGSIQGRGWPFLGHFVPRIWGTLLRIWGTLLNSFTYFSFQKSHPPSPFNCSGLLSSNHSLQTFFQPILRHFRKEKRIAQRA